MLERVQRLVFALGVAGFGLMVAGGIQQSIRGERRLPGLATPTIPYLTGLFERGEYDRAERELRGAIAIDPYGAARDHHNLGLALAFRGDFEGAIQQIGRAQRMSPADGRIHHDLGKVLRAKGDLDAAASSFERAARLRPGDREVLADLGLARLAQGRANEALVPLRRALELAPEDPGAHNSLGIALAQQGELAEATLHFQEALRIHPSDPVARRNLRRVEQQQRGAQGGPAPP
jgi:tetratricopeptide (TPR) repeat protein